MTTYTPPKKTEAEIKRALDREAEATARFCDNVLEFVLQSRASVEYLPETKEFFKYVDAVCAQTYKYAQEAIEEAAKPDSDIDSVSSRTGDFILLRRYLSLLHQLIKQASDASILNVPYPLIMLINRCAAALSEANKAITCPNVVPVASEIYNFHYDPLIHLRKIKAPGIVPDFPSNLGFIGLPFSERENTCANCALFHEFGHLVYDRFEVGSKIKKTHDKLLNDEDPAYKKILSLLPPSLFTSSMLESKGWRVLSYWANEIFSDLIAAHILGPGFIYTLWLLQYSFPLQNLNVFQSQHPAFLYRLSILLSELERLGWKEVLEKNSLEVVEWIRKNTPANPEHYRIAEEVEEYLESKELAQLVKDHFCKQIVPNLMQLAESIAKPIAASVGEYKEFVPKATAYFANYIVPSYVLDDDKKYRKVPCPALIGAAYTFYLNGMKEWHDTVELPEGFSGIKKGAFFYKKLNQFLTKAVSDAFVE